MSASISAILKKYASEDELDPTKQQGDAAGDLHSEIKKLRADPAYKDEFHPNHEKLKATVNAKYKELVAAKR